MAKAWTHRPSSPPTKQCSKCGKYYHARSKECPSCGAANPTRSGPERVVRKKKVTRRVRRGAPQAGRDGDALTAAIEFVEAAGGVEQAKAALDAIERIRQL